MGCSPSIFSKLLINMSAAWARPQLNRPNCSKRPMLQFFMLRFLCQQPNYISFFSVTVQVIPAAINTPAGTSGYASATSFLMRCIGRPQCSRVRSTLLTAFAAAKRCSNTQGRGVLPELSSKRPDADNKDLETRISQLCSRLIGRMPSQVLSQAICPTCK